MENAITRTQTPEEKELDKKLAELAALEAELAEVNEGVKSRGFPTACGKGEHCGHRRYCLQALTPTSYSLVKDC